MKEIKAYLRVYSQDQLVSKTICQALKPEVEFKPSSKRSRADIHCSENTVVLELHARDLNALRAMINAYLYLLHVTIASIESVRRISLG